MSEQVSRLESALQTWRRVLSATNNPWLRRIAERNVIELSGSMARLAREGVEA